MLRYGAISDWKLKFLQTIIEKFSILYKNFYYRGSAGRNILTYPDSTYQDRYFASHRSEPGRVQYDKLVPPPLEVGAGPI